MIISRNFTDFIETVSTSFLLFLIHYSFGRKRQNYTISHTLESFQIPLTHTLFSLRAQYFRTPTQVSDQVWVRHQEIIWDYLLLRWGLKSKTPKDGSSDDSSYNVPLCTEKAPKTTAKLIHNNVYCFLITIFRLAIPAFFRFTDVTELM